MRPLYLAAIAALCSVSTVSLLMYSSLRGDLSLQKPVDVHSDEPFKAFKFLDDSSSEEKGLSSAFLRRVVKFEKPCEVFKSLKDKLSSRTKPVSVAIFGGSNSEGRGLGKDRAERDSHYSESFAKQLEDWLIRRVHVDSKVHNFAKGAAGSCYFLRMVNLFLDEEYVGDVDLVVIESRLNDYFEKDCFDDLLNALYSKNMPVIVTEVLLAPHVMEMCSLLSKNIFAFNKQWLVDDKRCDFEDGLRDKGAYGVKNLDVWEMAGCERGKVARKYSYPRMRLARTFGNAEYCQGDGDFPFRLDLLRSSYWYLRKMYRRHNRLKAEFERVEKRVNATQSRDFLFRKGAFYSYDGGHHVGALSHKILAAQTAFWLETLALETRLDECRAVEKPSLNSASWMDSADVQQGTLVETWRIQPVNNAKLKLRPLSPVSSTNFELKPEANSKMGWISETGFGEVVFELRDVGNVPHKLVLGFLQSYEGMGRFKASLNNKTWVEVDALNPETRVSIWKDVVVGEYVGSHKKLTIRRINDAAGAMEGKIKILALLGVKSTRSRISKPGP